VGNELASYTLVALGAASEDLVVPMQADVTVGQFNEIDVLTSTTMGECLASAGGNADFGQVSAFPDGLDQVAIWNDCVDVTQAAVATRVAELAPRFFDPMTEAPTAVQSAHAPS
jgi:hypothetical protein